MQCDSTISIEKEGRNSDKASVPSIDQISSTLFHSIFPFHFASSNPSFLIDPIASTISNKRFFFFIIQEFSHKHRNSPTNTGIRLEAMVLSPFRLNSIMIVSSREMTKNTRKSISYQITAAPLFLSLPAWLPTMQNARQPMAANFGKFLQC